MEESGARKWLHESALERNSHELSRGDAIDVKASILLVVVFFLIDKISGLGAAACMVTVAKGAGLLTLGVCAVLCVAVLWPRDYDVEPMPSKNEGWIAQLEKYFSGDVSAIEAEVRESNFKRLKERAEMNKKINGRKMAFLEYSFYIALFSSACYLILLLHGRI